MKNQVDFFFKTLIVKLKYENNCWILTSKNGYKFKAKFLVCSSNLILHKRSLDILKINQIPLREAIPINNDKKIDTILNLLNKQEYVQRLTFLIYTKSNYSYKDNYKNRFRYFLLNNPLEEKFKFDQNDIKAFGILGISVGLKWEKIQNKFKNLVKKFHPDMNSGNKKYEEKLKLITLAYTQLKNTYREKIDT